MTYEEFKKEHQRLWGAMYGEKTQARDYFASANKLDELCFEYPEFEERRYLERLDETEAQKAQP